jgi:hypothetical protein
MAGIWAALAEGNIVLPVNFGAEKTRETADATGCKPVASIPLHYYGGPDGIRTHDLSDANRTRSQLRYIPRE